MSEWKEYKLEDSILIKNGKSRPPEGGNIPVYGGNGILGFSEKSNVTDDTVIIGRVGAYCGSVYFEDKPIWISDNALYGKSKKGFNAKFLYYLLKHKNLNQYSGGSSHPLLTQSRLNELEVSIPSLPTQTAIASILSSLDDKIELNNAINKNLEDLAQTLFKQWFVDFEFPNEKGEPYKSSGGEMVESELGEIPKGWTVDNLSGVLELIIDYRGKTPLKLGYDWSEDGIIALSAKNVKNRSIYNLDNVHIGSEELYNVWMKDKLQYGDVLLTSEAPLGETALLLNRNRYILSQRLFALRPNSKINPFFLFEWISSDVGRGELERRASGSTVVGIKQSELREISLVVPSTSLLTNYQSIVKDIYDSLEGNRIENEHLVKLRDSLLPKLISGELEVNEALLKTEKAM